MIRLVHNGSGIHSSGNVILDPGFLTTELKEAIPDCCIYNSITAEHAVKSAFYIPLSCLFPYSFYKPLHVVYIYIYLILCLFYPPSIEYGSLWIGALPLWFLVISHVPRTMSDWSIPPPSNLWEFPAGVKLSWFKKNSKFSEWGGWHGLKDDEVIQERNSKTNIICMASE